MFYTGRSYRAVLSGRLNSLIKAHQWHTHHGSNLHPQHTSSCNCSSPNHPTHPAGHQDTGHSWTPRHWTQLDTSTNNSSILKAKLSFCPEILIYNSITMFLPLPLSPSQIFELSSTISQQPSQQLSAAYLPGSCTHTRRDI